MQILEPGHVYLLDELDGKTDHNVLTFVNREQDCTVGNHPGTQTQEVLRALIDRTIHCDNCLRWEGNDLIIMHLRKALILHEMRALMRKTEKGLWRPERLPVGPDGHLALKENYETAAYEDQNAHENS